MCIIILLFAGYTNAAVSIYTDESEYLSDISTYFSFFEGFEDDAAWGTVRSPSTSPSVTNQGITWTSNNSTSEVTTGSGAARTGAYGFFTLPHGDFDNPNKDCTQSAVCGDGFGGTSSTTLVGVGGWLETNTPPAQMELFLDGVQVDWGEVCVIDNNGDEICTDVSTALGTQPQFFGVIDTSGFSSFMFNETEGTVGDQKFMFADDFTMAVVPEPISSTLFIVGGATLGFRQWRKRRASQ